VIVHREGSYNESSEQVKLEGHKLELEKRNILCISLHKFLKEVQESTFVDKVFKPLLPELSVIVCLDRSFFFLFFFYSQPVCGEIVSVKSIGSGLKKFSLIYNSLHNLKSVLQLVGMRLIEEYRPINQTILSRILESKDFPVGFQVSADHLDQVPCGIGNFLVLRIKESEQSLEHLLLG